MSDIAKKLAEIRKTLDESGQGHVLSKRLVQEMSEEVRVTVFQMLDREPSMTGEDAGKVAAAVEKAFLRAMEDL